MKTALVFGGTVVEPAQGIGMMCDCYPYDADRFAAYRSDYSRILLCDGPYAGRRCTREIFDELRVSRPQTMTGRPGPVGTRLTG